MQLIDLDTRMTPDISLVMICAPHESPMSINRALTSVRGRVNEAIIYWTGPPPEDTQVSLGIVPATMDLSWTDLKIPIMPVFRVGGINVKHIPGEWRDDFAWARNEALKHATGEWILQLDADEEFDVLTWPRLIAQINYRKAVYAVKIDSGCIENLNARLFPRAECQYQGRIHEQPTGPYHHCAFPDVRIIHHGYNVGDQAAKQQRNRRLLELQVKDTPCHPQVWMYYAQTLALLGETSNAVVAYSRALSCSRRLDHATLIAEQSACGLVGELCGLGEYREAIREGLVHDKDIRVLHPGFWNNMGYAYSCIGSWSEAIAAFELALAHQNHYTQQKDLGIVWKAHIGLVKAKFEAGRLEEARLHGLMAREHGAPSEAIDYCDQLLAGGAAVAV